MENEAGVNEEGECPVRGCGRQQGGGENCTILHVGVFSCLWPGGGDLEAQIGAFVDRYNHRRYHESLGNLTPADVYFGQHHAIIKRRREVKELTIRKRRLAHRQQAA